MIHCVDIMKTVLTQSVDWKFDLNQNQSTTGAHSRLLLCNHKLRLDMIIGKTVKLE